MPFLTARWRRSCCNSVHAQEFVAGQRSAVGTLAHTRFGSTTLHEACIFSGRALESAAYDPVVTSVLVGTLA